MTVWASAQLAKIVTLLASVPAKIVGLICHPVGLLFCRIRGIFVFEDAYDSFVIDERKKQIGQKFVVKLLPDTYR